MRLTRPGGGEQVLEPCSLSPVLGGRFRAARLKGWAGVVVSVSTELDSPSSERPGWSGKEPYAG
jgi:hypothetical protein